MISEADMDKLKIIDRYISSMTLDEVKAKFGEATTADKLSGTAYVKGPIVSMYDDMLVSHIDVQALRVELNYLKNDILAITKVLNTVMSPAPVIYNQELVNLKSKYGVY